MFQGSCNFYSQITESLVSDMNKRELKLMALGSIIKSWGQLDPCPLHLILSLLSAVHLLLDSLAQGLLFCLSPLHLLWLHLSFPTQFSILKEQQAYKHPMAEWVQRDDVSSLAGFPITVTPTPLGPVCVCGTSCAAFSSHYHTQREKENKLGPNLARVDFWVGLIAVRLKSVHPWHQLRSPTL